MNCHDTEGGKNERPADDIRLARGPLLLATDAAVSFVGIDLVYVATGSLAGAGARFTIGMSALLFASILSSSLNDGGTTFGLRARPRQSLRYWLRMFALLGVVGIPILVSVFVVLARFGVHPFRVHHPSLSGFFFGCVTTPLYEEIVYRLVFCPPAAALLGKRGAVIANGLVFALLHVFYGVLGPENLVGGFLLAWVFLRSGSLLVSLALHSLANLGILLINLALWHWRQP
jgi:membrane protease YdiL (CAAX protease family)